MKRMEIYSFKFGIFMNIIYALMAIGMAIGTAFVTKLVIQEAKKESKNGSKMQIKRVLNFMPFIIISLVLSILFGSLFVKYTTFDYNMSRGNASILEGDVKVVSLEEEYYRGSFSGYTVVLDAERIAKRGRYSLMVSQRRVDNT